jgi:hypothetical protein
MVEFLFHEDEELGGRSADGQLGCRFSTLPKPAPPLDNRAYRTSP